MTPLLGSGSVITTSSEDRELARSISASRRCLDTAAAQRSEFRQESATDLFVFSLSSCSSDSAMSQPAIMASNSALVAASAFLVTSGSAVTVS